MGADPLFTDGVIVIDKPAGPTSHDVVAVLRRRTQGRKVGHTGTLDPLASGVLPLVIGKATRLAQFLSSAEKEYDAHIELGVTTTTLDRGGEIVTRDRTRNVADLTQAMIEDAVAQFRGTYLQQPPAFSAKKIAGDRAYDLARRNAPVHLEAVQVTSDLEILEWRQSTLRLRLVCSAGFYVRSLADAIGERLGTGGHLAGLVRTRSGDFTLAEAVGLDVVDQRPNEAAARVIPLAALLPSLPALILTPEGASLAARGGFIVASHLAGQDPRLPAVGRVRLLHPDGHLVAIAEPKGGGDARHFLHPGVVLE